MRSVLQFFAAQFEQHVKRHCCLSLDAMVPPSMCGRCWSILHALQLQGAEEGACCFALPWVTLNLA